MLGGLLSPVGGILGSLFGGVSSVYDGAQDVVEGLAPGAMGGQTLTGNLLSDGGVAGDLLTNLGEGDVTGAISDTYANLIGPGGAVNDLANGGGLGIEGLLGNTLGLADGILGSADGLTDDLPVLGGSLI